MPTRQNALNFRAVDYTLVLPERSSIRIRGSVLPDPNDGQLSGRQPTEAVSKIAGAHQSARAADHDDPVSVQAPRDHPLRLAQATAATAGLASPDVARCDHRPDEAYSSQGPPSVSGGAGRQAQARILAPHGRARPASPWRGWRSTRRWVGGSLRPAPCWSPPRSCRRWPGCRSRPSCGRGSPPPGRWRRCCTWRVTWLEPCCSYPDRC